MEKTITPGTPEKFSGTDPEKCNYFLDVQFIEGSQKRRVFGINTMTPPTIDLISIAVAGPDGSVYYAVSNEFNLREAWDMSVKRTGELKPVEKNSSGVIAEVKEYSIRKTILHKIFEEFSGDSGIEFNYDNMKIVVETFGISRASIAEGIINFCRPKSKKAKEFGIEVIEPVDFPVFYSLYASHPWVAFCWLFEGARKIPSGFSPYCKELAQIAEEKKEKLKKRLDSEQDRKLTYSARENAEYYRDLHNFMTK